jgi:polysaccharide export outer membrane protein
MGRLRIARLPVVLPAEKAVRPVASATDRGVNAGKARFTCALPHCIIAWRRSSAALIAYTLYGVLLMAKRLSRFAAFVGAAWIMTLMAIAASATEETAAVRAPYTLNPGDVLTISVWKEQDLQRDVLVRPDGFFSFPLAGDIKAEGKSVDDIRQELSERLSRYIPDLVVTVAILQLTGNKIYVLGQVNRPGEFLMTGNSDVLQAIGMAGGPTVFAKVDEIKVIRRTNGTQISIPFRFSDIEQGRKLEQNILLRAGDTIVVP